MILNTERKNIRFKHTRQWLILLMELVVLVLNMELQNLLQVEPMDVYEYGIQGKRHQLFHLSQLLLKLSNLIVGPLHSEMPIIQRKDALLPGMIMVMSKFSI